MQNAMVVIGAVMFGILAVLVLSLLLSLPVMLLWNGCLVGAVVGVNPIGWLQAWGISILFGFLFKNSTSSKS
jgi:hypothetical protein